MEGRVLKGKNATFEASSAFKNIATSSGETLRTSRDILTATEIQKTSIGDVVKYVEEVVAIAEQTATGTQQVAGTAKGLSSSMYELTVSSQRLTDIADDLQLGLSNFQLLEEIEPEPEPEPVRPRRIMRRSAVQPQPVSSTPARDRATTRRANAATDAAHAQAVANRPVVTTRRGDARPATAVPAQAPNRKATTTEQAEAQRNRKANRRADNGEAPKASNGAATPAPKAPKEKPTKGRSKEKVK